MTLSPLQKLPIHQRKQAAGKPPALEWLPISALCVDDEYQRPISKRGLGTIGKIADDFRWARFSPVIVTKVGVDSYAIIDGQHRATAALSQGYDKVPAYIVSVDGKEAAQVFAAVNGVVTPMSAQSVFKAARAGGETWALEIDAACKAAGIKALIHPTPKIHLKTGDTIAVGRLRHINLRHGVKFLTAVLRCLMAFNDMGVPGNVTANTIRRCAQLFTGRPDWIASIDEVLEACASMGFLFCTDEMIEKAIRKRVGDGRSSPDARATINARVRDLYERKFNSGMIAASLRLPYAEVERALREIRQ